MKAMKEKEEEVSAVSSPYLSKGVYKNYAETMKEKNQKRKKIGLAPIYIRTYKEWSSQ